MTSLRPGEVVVDLGCGGGLDMFLAIQKVSPTGRAPGIDMTPQMVDRARRNAADLGNVECHMATIDALRVASASASCRPEVRSDEARAQAASVEAQDSEEEMNGGGGPARPRRPR